MGSQDLPDYVFGKVKPGPHLLLTQPELSDSIKQTADRVSLKWKKAAKDPISNEKICFTKPIAHKRTIQREKATHEL
jgi:hypothetical protein